MWNMLTGGTLALPTCKSSSALIVNSVLLLFAFLSTVAAWLRTAAGAPGVIFMFPGVPRQDPASACILSLTSTYHFPSPPDRTTTYVTCHKRTAAISKSTPHPTKRPVPLSSSVVSRIALRLDLGAST